MEWIDDEIFGQMWSFLDPLNYKERLAKIPKYIVLSSDDQFMLFDWTNKYFDKFDHDSMGETKLLIAPNSDHSLKTALPELISSASALARSVAAGNSEKKRPALNYYKEDDSKTIMVTIPEDGPKPVSVLLRHAETFSTLRRDFRWNVLAGDDNKNCSSPWVPLSEER